MDKITLPQFPVEFSKLEPVNPLFSKGRVRIFYPGDNRNGVGIATNVAEAMAASLPYTPIVGIFKAEQNDFQEHAEAKGFVKKAYGVVPANPNYRWEMVEEADGRQNLYLTADVYLWTARYPEAINILLRAKGQSMELDRPTIEGSWTYKNGKRIFEITKAYFSALCVLGDDVEPCFESAGFYIEDNFSASFRLMLSDLKTTLKEKGGEKSVSNSALFKLSHDDTSGKLSCILNAILDADGHRSWRYAIVKMFDTYAVIVDYNDFSYYRLPILVTEQEVVALMDDKIRVTIFDLSLEEEQLLAAQKVSQEQVATLKSDSESLRAAVLDLTAQIAVLTAEMNELAISKTTLENEKLALQAQLAELQERLMIFVRAEKQAIVEQFKRILSAEDVADVAAKMDEYSLEEIESRLAVVAVRKKLDFKTSESANSTLVFSNNSQRTHKESWETLVTTATKK